MRPRPRLILILACAAMTLWFSGRSAGEDSERTKATSRPAGRSRKSRTSSRRYRSRRTADRRSAPKKGARLAQPMYEVATPDQIAANNAVIRRYAEQARGTIVPALHLKETKHFLIFSAWHGKHDKALAEVCERMYAALCAKFAIPPGENIWVGKCPVFLFWDAEHFERFTTEVDKSNMVGSGGYNRRRSDGLT